MKRFWVVLGCVCLLTLAGCNGSGGERGSAAPGSVYCEPTAQKDYAALYLQVLEDLWAEDHGLNGGTYISVDLHEAPGNLTEEEIAAIAKTFAEAHGATPLTLSYRELADQGYLAENSDHWDDGVLYSIDCRSLQGQPLPEEHFSATKWVASEGAYFFEDCTAHWSESGAFLDYEIGGEAIS